MRGGFPCASALSRAACAAISILALSGPVAAQSVGPTITEYRADRSGKVSGTLEVGNATLFPLNVVLEPLSFSVDEKGDPVYRHLDPTVHIRFSATSFRLGPNDRRTIGYELSADALPAWLTVYATLSPAAAKHDDVKIALRLPHTVYLLSKEALPQKAIVIRRSESSRELHSVALEIENNGTQYGRVEEVEITSSRAKQTYTGFPFFPGQHRTLALPWNDRNAPEQVVLKFKDFKVTHAIAQSESNRRSAHD